MAIKRPFALDVLWRPDFCDPLGIRRPFSEYICLSVLDSRPQTFRRKKFTRKHIVPTMPGTAASGILAGYGPVAPVFHSARK